jgi:4-aminobutyrate aminotransferase
MTSGGLAAELYARDSVIAGVEKLRFFPLAVTAGRGCTLIEAGGRELLDLSATWTAAGLGHGHPAVVEAGSRALAAPPGAGALSAVHPDGVGLAEDLLALVPGTGDRRVYFGHAGTDANDVAIRCARAATGRPGVLAFDGSYHGGLGVAMGASGVHVAAGNAEKDPHVRFAPYPDPYRHLAVGDSLQAVRAILAAGDIACVIVEPILSDGGLVVPPDGFLTGLSAACADAGVLLICDEVKVGLGRSGLMHAFSHDRITPDLVTFGKALGAGLPISAIVGPAEVLDGPPASALLTTAGNPVCTAVGRAVLRALQDEDLAGRAAATGERLRTGLAEATADLSCVGDIRGRGLAIGVDLVADPGTRERAPDLAARTVYRLWQLGAVCYYVGSNVLEVTPPLVISDAEVDRATDLLATAIADAAAGRVDVDAVGRFAGW